VETWLRPGDALTYTLFNIALDLVVKDVLDDVTGLSIADKHQITLTAYADNMVIIEETDESVRQTTKKLINKEKNIGLQVNK